MRERVLVTGSSRGIGRAIAERLAKSGFEVLVHGRAPSRAADEAAAAVAALGGGGRGIYFDVSDRSATLAALEAEVEAKGAFWGVVCNAGIIRDAPLAGMSGEDWDAVLRTDLDGFYNVMRPLVMPMVQLRRGGRVVSVASVSGLLGNRGQTNYAAAKGGLIAAGKSLALELAKRGITVNCVAPGIIAGDMAASVPREVMDQIPLRRPGSVLEVAGLVNWLFSEEAAYVTRQVIAVDGGLSA